MSDETILLPCPFCGGSVSFVPVIGDWYDEDGEVEGNSYSWSIRHNDFNITCDLRSFSVFGGVYRTPDCDEMNMQKQRLLTAWNTRATHGTLTAEQVRELIAPHLDARPTFDFGRHGAVWRADFQAIADELNAKLGSDTKPCYAADENYKRCKYSVNRGWCDDAPFLVWDDTGHLFITLGGLKTWDVTDDAKKWFAELGNGTCKPVETETLENVTVHVMECDECGGTYEHVNGDYERCPRCGKAVER